MKANIHCSNCGAELQSLNMNWSMRRQWLWMLPILILGFLPLGRLYFGQGDFKKDLLLTVLERQPTTSGLDLLGRIENQGRRAWQSIEVEAEFYDRDGKFLGESAATVRSQVAAGESENFRISLRNPPLKSPEEGRLEVKVANAYSSPF